MKKQKSLKTLVDQHIVIEERINKAMDADLRAQNRISALRLKKKSIEAQMNSVLLVRSQYAAIVPLDSGSFRLVQRGMRSDGDPVDTMNLSPWEETEGDRDDG